tara:strand:- start:31 stop:426 length:396 start_codon:yes stop_codon:yes gene_type:complete
MKNWFNYKGTISGKTYLLRGLVVGLPLIIITEVLTGVNYYAGAIFYFLFLFLVFSFRYKRMSAVFKDKIDTGKKLFYATAVIDLIIGLYFLIDVESGQSEDFSYIELGGIPIFIFILYILFKNSDIEEHNG